MFNQIERNNLYLFFKVFANFRHDKQTQATDVNNCLSVEEEAKFVRDGKERGWFMLDNLANFGNPNMMATYYTRQIILAKMHAENYAHCHCARSNGTGDKLLTETHADRVVHLEKSLSYQFWLHCNCARSNGRGAKLLAETYAKKAAELENALIERYRFDCKFYYSKDSHGRFYRTEQD